MLRGRVNLLLGGCYRSTRISGVWHHSESAFNYQTLYSIRVILPKFTPMNMNSTYLLLAGLLLLFVTACERPYTAEKLRGEWTGVRFTQQGQDLKVNPRDFSFRFEPEGRYVYEGTSNYREEGIFRIEGDRLYTTDEIDANALEKAVRMRQLDPDTLKIQMNDGGKEQELTLVRKK